MKIKDIKRKSNRLSNEEAIKFLYFLMDWNPNYFDFIMVESLGCDAKYFGSSEEAREFIDELEAYKLSKITCDFTTSAITRFEFCFNYDRAESPGYAIINVTSMEK